MSLTFNQEPYYDDYYTNDVNGLSPDEKNYVRILFRPGYAVQARELTQMQTAIQAQISRHADFTFEEGSPVIGGSMFLDKDIDYIMIQSSFVPAVGDGNSLDVDSYYQEFVGTKITGLSTNITASVIDAIPAEGSDFITLYIRYLNSGSGGISSTFAFEEEFVSDAFVARKGKLISPSSHALPSIGKGTRFSIDESIFYVAGHFVHTVSDSKVVCKYNTSGLTSYRIGFSVNEIIVSAEEDITLSDNAAGTTNESAPGANRYQIDMVLTVDEYDFTTRQKESFLQLMAVENNEVKEKLNTRLGKLGDVLAQRTYEESGNYTIRPFFLNLRELYNDGTNNGLYNASQISSNYNQTVSWAQDRIALGLEKSTAYVQGYRVETQDVKYIPLEKARDYDKFYNASIVADYGNYVHVQNLVGLPDIDTYTYVNIKDASNGTIGTARVRSLEYLTNITENSVLVAIYRIYLFDINMFQGFTFTGNATRIESSPTDWPDNRTGSFSCDINVQTYGGTIYEPGNSSLVYQLPFKAVKTIANGNDSQDKDTTYLCKITLEAEATSGIVTLAYSAGEFEAFNSNDWIITAIDAHADTTTIAGEILNVSTFDYGDTSNDYNLTFIKSYSGTVRVQALVRKTLSAKTKNLSSIIVSNINAGSVGRSNSLGATDIYELLSVKELDENGVVISDITNRYYLDDGQRDNYYGIGRIILKEIYEPSVNALQVRFRHYIHSPGDYFSVDSYSTPYDTIKSFQSSKGELQLRDCIDFRPTVDDSGVSFHEGNNGVVISMIKPGSLVQTDIEYYLPRKDKVYLDKYGKFGIIKGVPSLNPKLPEDPKDAMVLYHLNLEAWTFGIKDVKAKLIDHRRYTMRDIGRLENRIKNLEYYTTLSMLEKDAQNYQNPTGTIKKGFMVDSFYGHNIGNAGHPDYLCSIDKSKGILRPAFLENYVRIALNENLTNSNAGVGETANFRVTGQLLTLDYQEVPYIEQPYSSYSQAVNPYSIFNWEGSIKLSPESDNWKDTESRPEVLIDQEGIYDTFVQMLDDADVIGTVWNEWQTNWTGRPIVEESIETFINGNYVVTSSTITESVNTSESRTGIRTEVVPDTVETVLGSRVVEVNFIPFIRSRIVSFEAYGMKPNTKVYAFFDGKDITEYTTQTDQFYQYSDLTVSNEFYTNSYNFNGVTSWPASITEIAKTDLYTDDNGRISGFFIVPNNDTMKFKVGERLFKLTSSSENLSTLSTTTASAVYQASGLLESRENLVLSTLVPRISRTAVSEDALVLNVNASTVTTSDRINSGWVDPLAQTIMIDEPGGIFATSIELYFSEYDPTIPVSVYIVPTDNGIPTSIVVPLTRVTKMLTANDVDPLAATPTKFEFDGPVHLQQGIEYAIIVISMSDKVAVWVSDVGANDITNPAYRISKQPYAGSFFTSQNASTWSADQNKDLKFKLNRAEFDTTPVEVYFQNLPVQDVRLGIDPIYTTNGTKTIRVYHKNHGMFEDNTNPSYVRISGVTSNIAGINFQLFNDVHKVIYVEEDFFEFEFTDVTSNATGFFGGSNVFSSRNIPMDLAHLQSQQISMPGTEIGWGIRTTSGRSIAGKEAPKVQSQTYSSLVPNENTFFSRPQLVPSNVEAVAPGLTLRASLASQKSTLSPVIDLDRLSMIAIHNKINNPTNDEPTLNGYNFKEVYIDDAQPQNTSTLANYITRTVQLAENSDRIRVLLSANRPSGTSVELWYKVNDSADRNISDLDWILHQPDSNIPFSENPNDYYDVEYSIEPDDLKIILDGTELVSTNAEFTTMAFKIVLRSSSNCYVPTVKDFRAIAFYSTI